VLINIAISIQDCIMIFFFANSGHSVLNSTVGALSQKNIFWIFIFTKILKKLKIYVKHVLKNITYLSNSLIVVASSNTSLLSLRKARNSFTIERYSELLGSATEFVVLPVLSSNRRRLIYKT